MLQGPGKYGGGRLGPHLHHHHRYDSANHSDQSDDNDGPLDGARSTQRGTTGAGATIGGMAPFRIAHTRPATADSADALV